MYYFRCVAAITRNILLASLLNVWCVAAHGQSVLQTATSLVVDPGTVLRIEGPLTVATTPGSSWVNNGEIHLGPEALLNEANGAPLSGTGTERITSPYTSPLSNEEPGGLRLVVTTVQPPQNVTLVRGHQPIMEPGGAVGTARWYQWYSDVNSGLDAQVRFGYDEGQLNGVAETDQVLHVLQSNTFWLAIPSSVDAGNDRVEAIGLDSIGTLTTFSGALTTGLADGAEQSQAMLFPTVADESVMVVLETARSLSLDLLDAQGRTLRSYMSLAPTRTMRLDVSALPAGLYLVRINGGRTLRFTRS